MDPAEGGEEDEGEEEVFLRVNPDDPEEEATVSETREKIEFWYGAL